MGLYDVIPLFVDTNLGTHFALSISQDITAGDLKDSMAIKHVFEELSGTWFLYLNASSMQNALEDGSSVPFAFKSALPNSSPHGDNQIQKTVSLTVADYRRLSSISNDGDESSQLDVSPTSEQQAEMRFLNTCCSKNVKKRSIMEHSNPVEADHPIIEGKMHESLSVLENSRKSSQTISVTDIISRFFSELDEVDSFYCQPKHIHETVQVRIDELRDSEIGTLAALPDHICNRKTVEFDTDTQCSFARKQEKNAAERAKVALKVKKMQQLGSKKLASKKSPLCTSHISSRMYIETLSRKSCKYLVGKRLVQAANSIQISGNGKKSATKILSKCKSSDAAVFDRRIAYDVDDFVD